MSVPDRLPDEALDSLLDGSPSEEAAGTPLAAYLDAVRHHAVTTQPRPSDELGAVLADGLDPAELRARGILTATAGTAATSWRRRGRLVLRALTAKFAALGILGKAAAAGAAVTVAASGAGAAGVLPPPAQSTFNEVIGREAPADAAGEGAEGTEIPADTSDTGPLDTDVPGDATDTSDGEAGVAGGGVADDASDGQSDASDDGDAGQRPDGPQDTPADDRIDDTPAGEVPQEAPPTPPTPTPAPERPATGDGAAEEGDVEQRPGTTDDAPRALGPAGSG